MKCVVPWTFNKTTSLLHGFLILAWFVYHFTICKQFLVTVSWSAIQALLEQWLQADPSDQEPNTVAVYCIIDSYWKMTIPYKRRGKIAVHIVKFLNKIEILINFCERIIIEIYCQNRPHFLENALAAGAPPQTPLGSLRRSPRPPNRYTLRAFGARHSSPQQLWGPP